MGSPDTERSRWSDEGPVHTVNIGYAFYMGKYEVTQAQYQAVVGSNPSKSTKAPNCPVDNVAEPDAVNFCDKLAEKTGREARLPTEAEWERAARGGVEQQRFPWGDELEPGGEHRMNVFQGEFPGHDTGADGYRGTAPVDAFEPNGFGLWNVTGNVWEWCADWFDPSWYRRSPREAPSGPPSGALRVMRGGSFLCHHSYCRRYRVAARSSNDPTSSTANLGFRVAADA